ncbi:MAG: hypothetical protein JRI77_00940 [Deltaproteobacteria bacterium]|nr:hypothetical protein [Deltaproteobacteria bacterium]
MDIQGIFAEIGQQMRADFRRTQKSLTHTGLKGTSNEEIVQTFLRSYLPDSLQVAGGQLIDSRGKITRQMDLIIFDALRTPTLFRSGQIQIIPFECAYAVIEIKALLDRSELMNAYQNMLSVRELKKVAYYDSPQREITVYGEVHTIWPCHYFLFAFDSIQIAALCNYLKTAQENQPQSKRIDSVCVLDKGVILNKLENGSYDALPSPQSRLSFIETKSALLLFYTLISNYLNQAWIPNFKFVDYLGEMTFQRIEPFATGDKVKCGNWVGTITAVGPISSEMGAIYTVDCLPQDSWLTPKRRAEMKPIQLKVPSDVLTLVKSNPNKKPLLKALATLQEIEQNKGSN